MTIVSQNKGIIANYDNIQEIFIGADRQSIKVDFSSGRGCEVGKYPSTEHCLLVLGTLAAAIKAGEPVYEFPQNVRR